MIGNRVSHYRVLDKLGEGGMGEVYAAFDETLHRNVALKAIRPGRQLDDEARRRFMVEARILSGLDHPGICRIHDYLRTEHGDFLVLELIEGQSLQQLLRQVIPRAQVFKIAEQVCEILAAAHEAGVVHRDLKPANVMVTPNSRVKVLDFGLSRRVFPSPADKTKMIEIETAIPIERGPSEPSGAAQGMPEPLLRLSGSLHTSAGTVIGTLHYMSPEQARGEPVTSAADLYSFGLILQEMLTRERGYPGELDAPSLHEYVAAGRVHVSSRLERDLEHLVRRLTEHEPAARPRAQETLVRLRWIHARPRRNLRRTLIATCVLVMGLWVLKYVTDLRAYSSMAQKRTDQAEQLIGFMLGDLRDKAREVGRLDLLDDVGRKALEYFAAVSEDELTDLELARRCQALYQLGEVQVERGKLAAAKEIFDRSLELAESLVERKPDNGEFLMRLGECQFFVGQVHYEQNHYEAAESCWSDYKTTAEQLVSLDPTLAKYRAEVAYALTNLAALNQRRGNARFATTLFERVVETWREVARLAPEEPEWTKEIGDALSWLGSSLQSGSELARATQCFRDELDIRRELHDLQPDNLQWELLRSMAHAHLGDMLRLAGDLEAADRDFALAVEISRRLCAADPENADWNRNLAVHLASRARGFIARKRDQDALACAEEAEQILEPLCRRDPSNKEWRIQRARIWNVLGEVNLARGRIDGVVTLSKRATESLMHETGPQPELGETLSEAWLLRGRATRGGDDQEQARTAVERSLEILNAIPLELRGPKTDELRAITLAHLDQREEAQQIASSLVSRGYRNLELISMLKVSESDPGVPGR